MSSYTGIIQLARSPNFETCIAPKIVRSRWPLSCKRCTCNYILINTIFNRDLPSYHSKRLITREIGSRWQNSDSLFTGIN